MHALIQAGDVVAYPYTDWHLRNDHPNTSFPTEMDDTVRGDFGVHRVTPTAVPAGKRAIGTTAGYVEGELVEIHTLEDIPLDELKAVRRVAVNVIRDEKLSSGFTVQEGPLAGRKLDTRDINDRTNWLVSQASYSIAVAAGQGAVNGATFRDADDNSATVSFADGLTTLLAMAAWGEAIMKRSWTLKDAITAAASASALDAIDINSGWPS